jgi:NAD(P)-dependent dehydrogenase (short-subunit alcohol dehydrogenase family)
VTVALVTGATDGIGRATALALAARGVTVLVHGRDAERGRAVVDALRPRGDVPDWAAEPFVADLARLADVRALADRVAERAPRLDVLVNNAGVALRGPERHASADGFELTMAVNHLAHFVLAERLRPLLERRDAGAGPGRVVTVASELHARGRLDWDDPFGRRAERYPGGTAAYAASKLANVLFARALARRADPRVLVSHALHPGVIKTKLLREGFGSRGGASVEEGAETSVHVALSDEAGRTTGRYWADARAEEPAPPARDDAAGERLWAASEAASEAAVAGA